MAQTGVTPCALVVIHHFMYIFFASDYYEKLFCSCYSRVQQISVAQFVKSAHYRENDSFKFTALTFVYSNCVGEVDLRQQVKCICCFSSVKVDVRKGRTVVDADYAPDISVKNACALFSVL